MSVHQEIDDFFTEQSRKNTEGTLTVGEAIAGYYRLLEGPDAGRVIIKNHGLIDGKPIIRYANGLTWSYLSKLENIRCERTYPAFSPSQHQIDYSQATWYNDDGSGPCHHEW